MNKPKMFKEKFAEMQEWYNGYTFGEVHNIYNPWSVIGYLHGKYKPYDYWANTGKPDLITQTLCNASSKIVRNFQQLVNYDDGIIVNTSRYTLIDELSNDEANIWGLLLHAGYLTATEIIGVSGNVIRAKVSVPNNEIKIAYYNVMRDAFIKIFSSETYHSILEYIYNGDADNFCNTISKHLLHATSFRDWPQHEDYIREFTYHTFINGLLAENIGGYYHVTSNKESGYGIYDMCLIPISKYATIGWVLEFKVADTQKQLSAKVKEGMQQMLQRKYMAELEAHNCQEYICLAIAFYKKQLKYQYKTIKAGVEQHYSDILPK